MRQYRFGILLAALLGMIVYAPLIDIVAPQLPPVVTRISLGIVFCWLTIGAVYAVSARRQAPRVALVLGVLLLAAELGDLSLLRSETHVLSHVFGILFMVHIVIVLLGFIFTQIRVDTDTIFTSLCVYLLLGIVWALFYSLLERVQPGSFSYSNAEQSPMRFGSEGTSLTLYFSFVTMTSLSYPYCP